MVLIVGNLVLLNAGPCSREHLIKFLALALDAVADPGFLWGEWGGGLRALGLGAEPLAGALVVEAQQGPGAVPGGGMGGRSPPPPLEKLSWLKLATSKLDIDFYVRNGAI